MLGFHGEDPWESGVDTAEPTGSSKLGGRPRVFGVEGAPTEGRSTRGRPSSWSSSPSAAPPEPKKAETPRERAVAWDSPNPSPNPDSGTYQQGRTSTFSVTELRESHGESL